MKNFSSRLALFSFAAFLLNASPALAQTTSINTGTLGAAGNGTSTAGVTFSLAGPLAAGNDQAAFYNLGERTQVPFNAAINPPAGSPFSIEFWAKPAQAELEGTGPAPVFNRVTASPRSGWVFFQRTPATGWEFRMYSGVGTGIGYNVEAGTYTPGVWTHVVTVWDGTSTPVIYVDGLAATNILNITNTGPYAASTAAKLTLGSYDDGLNPYNGGLDEFAFYNKVLTPAQILAHYTAAASPTAGTYSSLVKADGAVEYLQNTAVPEPTSLGLLGLGFAGCAGLKRFRRK